MFRTLGKNARTSPEARIMLGTMLLVFAGMINDILLSRGIAVVPGVRFWITPFAMFVFVAGIATILSLRFAGLLREVEELNENLESKVADRTAELDRSLGEIRKKDGQIQRELEMAGAVQRTLLPGGILRWPVKTAVRYKPLREVSGDFYQFLDTPDGGHLAVIGDVSGHGMPAAIYAILSQKTFHSASLGASGPAEILSLVNAELCKLTTGHYLTAFAVKRDGRGTLSFTNAGHPRAIWMSRKERKIRALDSGGTVIGIREDAETLLETAEIAFGPGDRVLLYTDCLLERKNDEGQEFGEARLVESLKRHFFEDLETLMDRVLDDYAAFAGDAENRDDLTLIGLEEPELA